MSFVKGILIVIDIISAIYLFLLFLVTIITWIRGDEIEDDLLDTYCLPRNKVVLVVLGLIAFCFLMVTIGSRKEIWG